MRWAGHVARMGEERGMYRFCSGFTKETNRSEDVGIDYRMVTRYEVRLSVVEVK